MKYMGSKRAIIDEIKPIINCYLKKKTGLYCEPFLGGANSFTEISSSTRLGADIDGDMIALFEYLRDNKNDLDLPYITEDLYDSVERFPSKYPRYMVGYVSICGSFRGMKWGGYAGKFKRKNGNVEDQSRANLNTVIRKSKKFQSSDRFLTQDYRQTPVEDCSVIYCDPPYRSTAEYEANAFNHKEFWQWVRENSHRSTILVSEYEAPQDFKVIWSKDKNCSLGTSKTVKRVEKLFKFSHY